MMRESDWALLASFVEGPRVVGTGRGFRRLLHNGWIEDAGAFQWRITDAGREALRERAAAAS